MGIKIFLILAGISVIIFSFLFFNKRAKKSKSDLYTSGSILEFIIEFISYFIPWWIKKLVAFLFGIFLIVLAIIL